MTGPVLLVVRPEQVSVTAGPAGVTGDGVTADVVEVSYFGHDATLRVRVRNSESVVIARVPAGSVPAPGTPVCLRVSGDVLAFPRSEVR